MMIFRVQSQVLRQGIDPFGENGNLYFRRTRIQIVNLEFLDDCLFLFFRESQWPLLFALCIYSLNRVASSREAIPQ